MNNKPLVILTGPTAVGKTELSLKIAKETNGEIISADSIQVYKGLDIGSAKITPLEMNGINHYLIDELEPYEEFNVYTFKKLANKYINIIYDRKHLPIITGGTGFYIQSVIYDIDFKDNDDDKTYRNELENLAKEKGNSYVYNILKEVDPLYAKTLHENNIKRVIRAIEFNRQTGLKMSEHNEEEMAKESVFNLKYFVLNDDRDKLYERINKRVDIMIENGLIDEVNTLKANGITKDMTSMQGIGYKEIYSYLNGEISKEEAIELIKKNTRHFAKRQLTWFRREKNVIFVNKPDFNYDEKLISEFMLEHIAEITK